MSASVDSLPQPKVRFTQSPVESNPSGPFRGPRIREIVTLKRPVRLVSHSPDENAISDLENVVPSHQKPPKPKIVTRPEPPVSPTNLTKKTSTVPSSSEVSRRPKPSAHDLDYLQTRMEELKTSDKPKRQISATSKDSKKTLDPNKNAKFTEPNPSKSILRSKNTPASQTKQVRPLKPEKKIGDKENLSRKTWTSAEGKTSVKKPKTVLRNGKIPSGGLTGPPGGSGGGKSEKCPGKGPATSGALGLMPCMKGRKITETRRNEVNVLRHVARPLPKVFVGPGVPRNRGTRAEGGDGQQTRVDGATGDQLRRPEYNSIVCTIKKLEEIRRQKVVGNFDNLPGIYKDLVNGKISSALDIPAFESVYHDLIDISIDEKQLPMRLTRSRDPEPRPKDFIPNLSDFFVPQSPKEYSMAVKVRPRTPEILDNWSGFNISDKINTWRTSLNESSI